MLARAFKVLTVRTLKSRGASVLIAMLASNPTVVMRGNPASLNSP
jgi:hypothetical protein